MDFKNLKTNVSVAVNLPLLEDLNDYCRTKYINRSDFIRQAIREKLEKDNIIKK